MAGGNKERFLELDLEPIEGVPDSKPEKVRLGIRFTEQARYEWEVRGYQWPTKAETLQGRTAKMKQLLWAGLEGYRDFHGEDRVPWTIRSVNELVERAGGWSDRFWQPLLDAYAAAFPARKKAEGKAEAEATTPGEPTEATEGGPTGTQRSESRSATG